MATKKQRFVTLSTGAGSRMAIDLSKVEMVRFAQSVPGVPEEYTRRLVLQLPGGPLEVAWYEADRVLELLGVDVHELEEEWVA